MKKLMVATGRRSSRSMVLVASLLISLSFSVIVLAPGEVAASSIWSWRLNAKPERFAVRAEVEMGTLGFISHWIQIGKGGNKFDYVKDGSQDLLFPFTRYSAQAIFGGRHRVIFLYQPLDVRTQVNLSEKLVQDQATFDKGEAVDLRYGFDYYRLSYSYDLLKSPNRELSVGFSLQLRDAVILFTNAKGSKRSRAGGVGPVPIIKVRGRFPIVGKWWFGFEVDGFYAPVSYINGSDNEIVGAIVDGSVRIGRSLAPFMEMFAALRYVGGGSVGTGDPSDRINSDGFVENWIHLFTISLGVALK